MSQFSRGPSTGVSAGVSSLNGESGAINIVAGSGIIVTPAGQNITIAATDPGDGTVTSVALTAPASLLSVSGSPITTAGTLALALATQSPNLVFAGPTSGGAVVPTFRSLVAGDIPSLNYVSSIGVSVPLVSTGGLTPTLSIPQATTSVDGFLSHTDWNTFNGKQAAGSYITALTGGITATGPGSVAAQLTSPWGSLVAYTDPLTGNNSTAQLGHIELPFADPAAAMAAITTAGPTQRWVIYMAPGIYTVATLVLKAYVSIVGIDNPPLDNKVRLTVSSGNITLDQTLVASASRNLISDITLVSTGISYNSKTIGGSGVKVLTLNHVATAVGDITFSANTTSDALQMDDCYIFGNISASGGNHTLNNLTNTGNITIDTQGTVNVSSELTGVLSYGTVAFNSTGSNTNVSGMNYSAAAGLQVSGTATQLYPDVVSMPLKGQITFANGAVDQTNLIRQSDSFGIDFTPGVLLGGSGTPATNVLLQVKNGHIKSIQTTAPTTTTNANAGTGASSSVSSATDSAGALTLTLGSIGTLASGVQVTVNFNKAYVTAPIVTLTPTNSTAATNIAAFGVYVTSTTAGFSVNFGTAGIATDVLTWNYLVVETQ